MQTVASQCPNCNGTLIYQPDQRLFVCEYCQSSFSDSELIHPSRPPGQNAESVHTPSRNAGMPGYTCPNCGAGVVCDDTAATAYCYYCKSPVVLEQRVSGAMEPEKIVPFSIGKEKAAAQFRKLLRSKWFAPSKFHSKSQFESLTGVYLPHWVSDCDVAGRIVADANQFRTWRSGDTEFTEISTCRLFREGNAQISGLCRLASSKVDQALVEAVGPFDMAQGQPFSPAYLSGFQAQIRDLEFGVLRPELEQRAKDELEQRLAESCSSHGALTRRETALSVLSLRGRYMLLPVWLLTCRKGSKIYRFAINGQTGKACGEVPLSRWKLFLASFLVFCGTFILIWQTLGGGL